MPVSAWELWHTSRTHRFSPYGVLFCGRTQTHRSQWNATESTETLFCFVFYAVNLSGSPGCTLCQEARTRTGTAGAESKPKQSRRSSNKLTAVRIVILAWFTSGSLYKKMHNGNPVPGSASGSAEKNGRLSDNTHICVRKIFFKMLFLN